MVSQVRPWQVRCHEKNSHQLAFPLLHFEFQQLFVAMSRFVMALSWAALSVFQMIDEPLHLPNWDSLLPWCRQFSWAIFHQSPSFFAVAWPFCIDSQGSAYPATPSPANWQHSSQLWITQNRIAAISKLQNLFSRSSQSLEFAWSYYKAIPNESSSRSPRNYSIMLVNSWHHSSNST